MAAITNIEINSMNKKEGMKMCSLFEEIARDNKTEGKAESVLELLEEYGEISEKLRNLVMNQTDLKILKNGL